MDHVLIIGTIERNGSFIPGWWGTPSPDALRAVQAEPSSGTPWLAIALHNSGEILARAPARLVEMPICPGGSRLELSALLAVPEATSAVAILDGDREVFRRAVPEPGNVRLERLSTRLGRSLIEVRVGIDGPGPPPGAYIIPRWEAPGHPALPLGLIGIGAGEPAVVRLDLAELPGGEGCRLSVIYFDGIRTVAAFSELLSVEPRAAVPVIVAPTPGMELFDDSWLSLEGRLDGDGDPEALEWLLDEELVGTGPRSGVARPGVGARTVTLRHGTACSSAQIGVHAAPPQDAAPPWAPPWRSRPFRSVSTPSLGPKASSDG